MPVITKDINLSLQSFLSDRSYSNLVVLVDENTKQHCLPILDLKLDETQVIEIKSGEENKNLKTCVTIWERMTALGLDRKALLINLGGGVIGDMGGFCAASYKRGIDFINIPTTLLSQVDASVGGKLGIDFKGYKNHIGLFKNPETVLIDTNFLKTLSKRELRSGFAEIIKHSLIASKTQWNNLKLKSFDEHDFTRLVAESVEIKQKIAEEDPLEQGKRKILNFGHTIGHAIESFFLESGGSKLLHGEAIAIGMVCEAYIAKEKNLISEEELEEITKFIVATYAKTQLDKLSFEKIIALMYMDKKNIGNKILLALPKGIGKALWDVEVDHSALIASFHYYIKY